jgi:hypothetical protein
MNCKLIPLFFILALVAPALAETSGNISLDDMGIPPATGLFGYTVQYCNATADCMGYYCFEDYDGESSGNYQGWCFPYEAKCAHRATSLDTPLWYDNGYDFCADTSVRKYCSSGAWASEDCEYGCVNGTCQSSSDGDTETYTSNQTTPSYSISVISYPDDFNITQGLSVSKSIKVKNNGDYTLYAITLSLSGISFYSISPSKITSMTVNQEKSFIITFTVPANATVQEYTITAAVDTDSSATASASFKIKVLPSSETIEQDIMPLYNQTLYMFEELEKNITELEARGINTSSIRSLFNQLRDKISQINSSMQNEDYFTASMLLNTAGNMIEDLGNMISSAEAGSSDITLILIILAAVGITAAVLAYLFWPTRRGYKYEGGSADVKDILKKIKEKRRPKK